MNQFVQIAADTAMKSAVDYIMAHDMRSKSLFDHATATWFIKKYVKFAIGPALNDAKEAIDANMGSLVEATFLTSMRLAGINAMKEYEREL